MSILKNDDADINSLMRDNLPTPPQMPSVIYACADSFESHGEVLTQQTKDPDYATSYTRTDLCEELKAALRDLIEQSKPFVEMNNAISFEEKKLVKALTKAQGLLR